jgi:hypothetical protein
MTQHPDTEGEVQGYVAGEDLHHHMDDGLDFLGWRIQRGAEDTATRTSPARPG